MKTSLPRTIALGLAVAAAVGVPGHALAQARRFDVATQSASGGLRQLARQAGIQIVVAGRDVKGRRTNTVRGTFSIRAALDRLVAGTGLRVSSFDGSLAVLNIEPVPVAERPPDTISVTGSRIPRPELASAMPVSVTRMDEAFSLGRTSAYDALMRDPAIGVGIGLGNSYDQTWDAGVSSVDLRNLGTNRSLTLLDGMRRVSGSARSSAVDINMVPPAMIDRIEVVTGGAAAIYGADAVTGAVNIITKRDVHRLTISATNGISGRGDARELSVSVSTGARFGGGRGTLAIGGTYSRTDPLHMPQRFDWQDQPLYLPNPANTGIGDGIPDRVTLYHYRQIYYSYQPTFWLNGQNWIVDGGAPRPATHDTYYARGEFALGDGGDGRNLEDQRQLRGGLEALAVLGRATYAFTGGIDMSTHFSFGRTRYDGTDAPYRDDSRAHFLGGAGGAVAYLDNPYLPDAVRRMMLGNGLTRLNISRTYGNFPIVEERHERENLTLGQTLRGRVNQRLKWEAFYQYGRTTDRVTTSNIPDSRNWVAARDVISDPVTGEPACRDPATRAAGCVPLDIFSLAPPGEALLSYVLGSRLERRTNRQHIVGGTLSGSALTLPFGAVSMVLGVEHRTESLETRDDPRALNGRVAYSGGPAAHPELDERYHVSEIYGELVAPLLRDMRFARRLELEGAYRYSNYSTVGGTHTWKLGGRWAPVQGLTFRTVRSRSVRTPNFGELFEPQVASQLGSIDDPCEAGAYYASATRARNCAALGVATPLPDVKAGPIVTTSGNPNLRPETSNSMTLGIIVQPRALPGFDLTVDYWDINIADVITQFSYSRLLYLCVDLPTIDNPYCKLSQREAPLGNPISVTATQINASRMYARGIDAGATYRRPLGTGALELSFKGTYLIKQVVETTPGVSTGDVRYDGGWRNPRFRFALLTAYRRGDFSVSLSTRFLSAGRYDLNVSSSEAYDNNHVPSRIYSDLYLQYDVSDRYRIGIGVRNLFNAMPPYMPSIYYNNTVYDVVGRYFYANARITL